MDFSLLSKYKISYPPSVLCSSSAAAVKAADEFGYPVVLKLISPQVLHKSDKGGVILRLGNQEEVAKAYELLIKRFRGFLVEGVLVQKMVAGQGPELIVGGKKDAQFGQLIMLGLGGIFVEVFRDVTFRVCPIAKGDAQEMIRELRAYPILAGARGRKPISQTALVGTLLKVSNLLMEEDPLEFDLNPLVAGEKDCVALDMRILR